MKVSIITVSFNSKATIGDTLRSVSAQTHPDIEHIVVDGASSDGTVDVVRQEGGHVAKVLSEPDRGIYFAMNKGLKLATGDLVGFLNADDVFADRSTVARLVATASLTKADAVFGDLAYVRSDNLSSVVRYWSSGEFSPGRLRLGWMPPHPTFYVNRLSPGLRLEFDTSLRIASDYEFMMRCLTRSGVRAAYVPHVIVRMRMGGISNRSVSSMLEKSREDLTVMRRYGIGGWMTLVCKNLSKLPQFLRSAPTSTEAQGTGGASS